MNPDETHNDNGGLPAQAAEAAPAVEPCEGPETDRVELSDAAARLEAALAEKARLEDLLLRRQADYENFRKRAERERLETLEYAGLEAARALVPVLDDFERALKAAPAGDGALRDYAKGMELIYQRMLEVLTRLGLQPMVAAGERFDPHLHNAVQREERDDVEDQTVLEEYQRGYHFKGRLLRPAMVKVAVKP